MITISSNPIDNAKIIMNNRILNVIVNDISLFSVNYYGDDYLNKHQRVISLFDMKCPSAINLNKNCYPNSFVHFYK